MYPASWGPLFHDVLLFLSVQYPEDPSESRQNSMQILLEQLFANLPCLACTVDASVGLYSQPADVSSRAALQQWLVELHNRINQKLHKRSDWTVEEALEAFSNRYLQEDNLGATVRAETKRLEDHQHIARLVGRVRELQSINAELKSMLEHSLPAEEIPLKAKPLEENSPNTMKRQWSNLARKYIAAQTKSQ